MLDQLAIKHGTDKSSKHHGFAPIYEHYLSHLKYKKISIIECGVGGYEYPDRGGESLRMWYDYFPAAKIIGIDLYNKGNIINDRTEFWQGSQTDENLLTSILDYNSDAVQRIFIDDASHHNLFSIETFAIVFPKLKSGDLYFLEDCHTSYFSEEYMRCSIPFQNNVYTVMQFFTELTHQLNAKHFGAQYWNDFKDKIAWIHFYPELIAIKRK